MAPIITNRFVIQRWRPLLALSLLILLLGCLGEAGRELLRYDRPALESGELWRLVTGHLTHLGWRHLLLNLSGLLLMAGLFLDDYGSLRWLWILALSAASIDAGLFFLNPSLQWYVGLSGILHGAMAAGLIAHWRRHEPNTWLLTVLLVAKLIWEQAQGALPFSGDLPVVVDAHLYGALGGASAALVIIPRRSTSGRK